MANPEHLALLQQGVEAWNKWRQANLIEKPDLGGANLGGAYLRGANLMRANLMRADLGGANLREADLGGADLGGANLMGAYLEGAYLEGAYLEGAHLVRAHLVRANLGRANLGRAHLVRANLVEAYLEEANLWMANLMGANLIRARLREANLRGADLRGANLEEVNLMGANLMGADLEGANLREANISYAILVETIFTKASLRGCRVYGCSAWNLILQGVEQINLVISKEDEPLITVDNLEVAQFIYLLLNNEKIRHVIDTITTKVVLILGRFTPERKAILDALRTELRNHDYLPILFDFEKPTSRSFTETVSTLAHMARFIIADITGAKSIPQELTKIIPGLPHVPVQPLLLKGDSGFAMFEDYRFFPWVLPTFVYDNEQMLLMSIKEKVIEPVEAKAKEQATK